MNVGLVKRMGTNVVGIGIGMRKEENMVKGIVVADTTSTNVVSIVGYQIHTLDGGFRFLVGTIGVGSQYFSRGRVGVSIEGRDNVY
jgi:hypothetical protein